MHQVRKNLVREDGTKRFTINKESADYTIYVHESRASAASIGENTDGGQSQAVVASEHGSKEATPMPAIHGFVAAFQAQVTILVVASQS